MDWHCELGLKLFFDGEKNDRNLSVHTVLSNMTRLNLIGVIAITVCHKYILLIPVNVGIHLDLTSL